MLESHPLVRFFNALDRLNRLSERFERARVQALAGLQYDTEAFDQLVVECRQAMEEADEARRAVLAARLAHGRGQALPA